METQKKYRVLKAFNYPVDEYHRTKYYDIGSEFTYNKGGILDDFLLYNDFIEPNPESKMQIFSGYNTDIYTHMKKVGKSEAYKSDFILIENPTPLMKQVVKQIEKGECYERYTPFQSMLNKMKNNEDVAIDLWVKQGGCNHHKLLIIPMEDER